MTAKTLVVTSPLVIVKDESGAGHYVYEGGIVPAFVDGAQKDRLLADGLIGEQEAGDEPRPARKTAATK